MGDLNSARKNWKGLLIAVLVGIIAVMIKNITRSPILDPLLVALLIGAVIRSFVKFDDEFVTSFRKAPLWFIPIGVIFYGAVNLNFVKFASVDAACILMIIMAFEIYVLLILLLAHLTGLNKKTGYLIASGSAICGASAIAITSKAIDAEPDDVSVSLISVFLSGLIGLFIILPFLAPYFGISESNYGILSGTVLQFTGFVKASVAGLSEETKAIALSVKAVRYTGLLILIPIFASMVKGKLYIPWYLWAFLFSGLVFTFVPHLSEAVEPAFNSILTILWSIAMGAIGLNARIKTLFTKNGIKAFAVSLIAFSVATGALLSGMHYWRASMQTYFFSRGDSREFQKSPRLWDIEPKQIDTEIRKGK